MSCLLQQLYWPKTVRGIGTLLHFVRGTMCPEQEKNLSTGAETISHHIACTLTHKVVNACALTHNERHWLNVLLWPGRKWMQWSARQEVTHLLTSTAGVGKGRGSFMPNTNNSNTLKAQNNGPAPSWQFHFYPTTFGTARCLVAQSCMATSLFSSVVAAAALGAVWRIHADNHLCLSHCSTDWSL